MVMVATALVTAYLSFFTLAPSVALLTSKYRAQINVSFQMLYKRLTESDLKLDSNKEFVKRFQDIKNKTMATNVPDLLFFLKDDYKPETTVTIPLYFHDEAVSRPIIQPQDPRFTLSVYLEWIKLNPGSPVPFHWSDWIDLLDLNKYILIQPELKPTCDQLFDISNYKEIISDSKIKPVSDYCSDDKNLLPGFRVHSRPGPHTKEMAKLIAKLHVYTTLESPTQLIVLTNSRGSYHIDILNRENDLKYSLLNNGITEEVYTHTKSTKVDVLETYKSLLQSRHPNNPSSEIPFQIDLQPEWFEADARETVKHLKDTKRTQMEQNYLESLEFSLDTKDPAKSFSEAQLLNIYGDRVYGDHHDWRFFNGLTVNTDPQLMVLHRLLKNYLQFCRIHGLVTWIAHGSLLLWYWNGMSFPWDTDTDVQMPIRDLHRLGREFNQTLVIENIGHDHLSGDVTMTPFNGMGTFYIEVTSSITHRDKGNGNNNIDARFIDIQNGLYVDITGLSVSEEPAPSRYDYVFELEPEREKNAKQVGTETAKNIYKQAYNCRNRHFSLLSELSPLIMTGVQNQIGHIPKFFGMMLNHEYNIDGMIQNNFESSYYLPSLRIWAKTNTLVKYFVNKKAWIETQDGPGAEITREATEYERH